MKHIWTVACSRAVIDSETNNVNLQNVVEELTIHAPPQPDGILPIDVDVVSTWIRDALDTPEAGEIRVSFRSPKGKSLRKSEGQIDLNKAPRFRVKARFSGLPLAESGVYSFRVDARESGVGRWRKYAEIPLIVVFSPEGKKKRAPRRN